MEELPLFAQKNVMNPAQTFILSLLLPLAVSCALVDDGGVWGGARRPHARVEEPVDDSIQDDPVVSAEPDTAIYVSAVRADSGCDYLRQDPGPGSEIVLFKNFKQVLSVPFGDGAGPDPDTHHLIDGHLWTERSTLTQTVICRDSVEKCRFDGREYLLGLLPVGDDVYTLSHGRDDDSFTYRKNSQVLYRKEAGSVFGNMQDPSYGNTGALYLSQTGRPCFCYSGSGAYYAVEDGLEIKHPDLMTDAVFQDVKFRKGCFTKALDEQMGYKWQNARVWIFPGQEMISGDVWSAQHGCWRTMVYRYAWFSESMYAMTGATVYLDEEVTHCVAADRSGVINVDERDLDGAYMGFTPNCATIHDGLPALALTPRDTTLRPFVTVGGERTELDIYGYLTGIEVVINPPSSEAGTDPPVP